MVLLLLPVIQVVVVGFYKLILMENYNSELDVIIKTWSTLVIICLLIQIPK